MGVSDRAAYRFWQFWQAIRAEPLLEEGAAEVAGILHLEELELFYSQDLAVQQHGYRVMKSLKGAGYDDPDLLAAALLHDVGKGEVRSEWWDRPLVVMGQALLPRRAAGWASGNAEGWRRPFVVKAAHPDWGANAAEACGSSPFTVKLIRDHQIPLHEPIESHEGHLMALLQWADNMN